MRLLVFVLLAFVSSCSTRNPVIKKSCSNPGKADRSFGIIGTRHCRSISIANGVIVTTEEIDPQLLTSVSVLKCPDSYEMFGDIGSNGVIIVNTTQKFDFKTPASVYFKEETKYADKRKIYFLNGFLIKDDSLKISLNAIKRIQVLNSSKFNDTENIAKTVLINLWTFTKKEVRKSSRKCNSSIM